MLDIEALISSSLPWWEGAADLFGIVAGVSAVVAILVDVVPFVSAERAKSIKWGLAFVLIAGVFGQIAATHMVSNITHQITAFLNDKAQTANDRAQSAKKDAETLAVDVEVLKGKNLELARSIQGKDAEIAELRLHQQFTDERQRATDKKFELAASKNGPRPFDANDFWLHTRKLRSAIPLVTVKWVGDPEPKQFFDKMDAAFKRSRIDVVSEPLKEPSPYSGVFVCNGPGARRLSAAMRLGGVENTFLTVRSKEWNDICAEKIAAGFVGFTGSIPTIPRDGVTIFIGHDPRTMR